jgi:hypothetical protein
MRHTATWISLPLAVALAVAVADGQLPSGNTGWTYPLVPTRPAMLSDLATLRRSVGVARNA